MARRIILGVLLCAAMTLGGCGVVGGKSKAPAVATSPVIARILERGVLIVGTSGNQPPLTAATKSGEIIGLDADLAQAIAMAMGVELRLQRMQFPELLPALERGKVDLVISGMTMTPKRNLGVAFVGPYFVDGKALLTKSKKMAEVKESAEINNPGVTLAALRGSTSESFVETAMPKARLVLINDDGRGVADVIAGKVDALVADFTLCAVSVFRYPADKLSTLVAPLTFEPLGIALPADDPLLVNWTENLLLMLEGTGQMDALRARWLQDGSWLSRLE